MGERTRNRQDRMMRYIERYVDDHDRSPSIREIKQECDISSTSVVDYNLKALQKLGVIERDDDVARGIRLRGRPPRVVLVPVMGTIAAGQPIPVPGDSDPEETIEVAPETLKGRDKDTVFALRVKGDSMIDALIADGDIVLMQTAQTAQDGEIVAAWLKDEGETTLKKLYREGDRVRLQPRNPTMAPIYSDAGNVEIQARFIATMSTSS
jgi:repressor LexA